MGKYEQVLERLVRFRKTKNLTQVQMAEKLNISQEQYSYLENGKAKITADMLKALDGLGLDINYLITGKDDGGADSPRVEGIFETVGNEEYRKKLKRLLVYLLSIIYIKDTEIGNVGEDEGENLLKYLEKYGDDFSMILYVRKRLQYSQIVMADQLGLGIKKYRKLEKEIIYPDAELLFLLWSKSKYPPVLFLNLCDRELYIIDLFWSALPQEQKTKIADILHNIELCCSKDIR